MMNEKSTNIAMIDEYDPDNYPYDNVEFPVRKPARVTPSPSPRVVATPDKSSLQPVFEALEIDAIEADNTAHKTPNLTAGGRSTQTSTVLFIKKPATTTSYDGHNSVKTTQNETLKLGTNSSPINRLKSSMVESKQQTTLGGDIKPDKTTTIIRPPQPSTWPFERNDFNAHSQNVLDEAYLRMKSYNHLHEAIIEQGHVLQKPLRSAKEKLHERLTYEQLLQGMLFDGERLLLNGHWVYFNRVQFLSENGEQDVRPALGNGRACLTNKRLLILVAEPSTDADLHRVKDTRFRVCLTQRDDIVYLSIPMHCFRSVEMAVSVGAIAESVVTQEKPTCGCMGKKKWKSSAPTVTPHNTRTIQMGVVMPPWNTHTQITIHTHPELPLTLTRDFVAYVQSHAQQLH